MTLPFPVDTVTLECQPVEWVDVVCGISFRVIILEKKGHVVPQHHHDSYDHATFIGSGSAALWVNNVFVGVIRKGKAIEIKAGDEHLWQAQEDGTLLACITNAEAASKTLSA